MSGRAPDITALVLAGQRPGTDPLTAAYAVKRKAMIRVAGEPMLAHMLATLSAHRAISRIIVAAQDCKELASEAALSRWRDDDRVTFIESRATIAATLSDLLERGALENALVTTADNVLLTPAMIDHFLGHARSHDLAIAMVEKRTLMAHYPEARRTWIKFGRGWWSGANLFWLGGERVRPAIELWRGVEQDRKKGWRIVAAFGPLVLIGAALRLLTLPAAIERVGRRIGIDARLVPMPQAEACIDVDKPEDLTLAEAILAAR